MNEEILKPYVRPVTDKDKDLPRFSYSKFEVLKNCPYQYNLKYNQKKYSDDTSLALELGSICHYVLEQKGIALTQGQQVNYDLLNQVLVNGHEEIDEEDKKTKEKLAGLKELKKKYFETWYEKDNASGQTYEEKMKLFQKVLHSEMESGDWFPTYFERPFEFVWDNKIIIHGFIDRIDIRDNEYKTVDYKTSKKVFDQSKLSTSLQFGIYALAILNDFGKLPIESEYRFILIDDKQYALTKGWEKRLITAINKLIQQVEDNSESGQWKPSPTPLCYWCYACAQNPDATKYKDECEYYSLWTPTNKTFEKKKEWDPSEEKNSTANMQVKRKLIF